MPNSNQYAEIFRNYTCKEISYDYLFTLRAAKFVDNRVKEGNEEEIVTEEMIEKYYLNIRYLGRLLDFDIEGSDLFLSFQEQLEILDQDPQVGMWNVQKTFDSLAPSCEELLLVCRFRGVEKNCSEVFKTRRTGFGSCCVFNFARPVGATG